MKKSKILPALSITFLILFLIILFNLSIFHAIDNSANLAFSINKNNSLIDISKAVGWLFEPEIVIIYALIISVLLFVKKHKKDSVIFAVSMLVGGAFMWLVKEIVHRARPENALVLESSYSFPSGHAVISVIFLGFFIYLVLKNIKSKTNRTILSIILIIATLFIGISRLILNVHWLSDVLGGWLLGLSILLASISIEKK